MYLYDFTNKKKKKKTGSHTGLLTKAIMRGVHLLPELGFTVFPSSFGIPPEHLFGFCDPDNAPWLRNTLFCLHDTVIHGVSSTP